MSLLNGVALEGSEGRRGIVSVSADVFVDGEMADVACNTRGFGRASPPPTQHKGRETEDHRSSEQWEALATPRNERLVFLRRSHAFTIKSANANWSFAIPRESKGQEVGIPQGTSSGRFRVLTNYD